MRKIISSIISMTQKSKTPVRRRFLKSAAGGAVATGALAAPMVSTAQTINLRFQSTWPSKDIFHEYALDFAKKVNDMTGGRLKIEVLPAGAVVKALAAPGGSALSRKELDDLVTDTKGRGASGLVWIVVEEAGIDAAVVVPVLGAVGGAAVVGVRAERIRDRARVGIGHEDRDVRAGARGRHAALHEACQAVADELRPQSQLAAAVADVEPVLGEEVGTLVTT